MASFVPVEILKTYKKVHTWTGILSALFLFVAFYAGALTMFKEPLDRWAAAAQPFVMTSLAEADVLVDRTLRLRPEIARSFTLHVDPDGETAEEETGESARAVWLSWSRTRDDPRPWRAVLDEEDVPEISRPAPSQLAVFIDNIHRTAGLPVDHETGAMIMGLVSLLYMVALVSGVIVLLPSLVKDFLALRVGANLKRMWLDLHNLLGLVSLPFHFLIAFSAMVFGLHDEIYDLMDDAIYGGRMQEIMRESSILASAPKDKSPADMLPPERILQILEDRFPEFEVQNLNYMQAGTGSAAIRVQGVDDRYLMRGHGYVLISAVNGDILNTDYMPGYESAWPGAVAVFFALHFGSFGGDPIRFAYLALGLAGAFIFYSGNLLWIESRRKTARREGPDVRQARNCLWMASGSVGVCLGAMAGLSGVIAADIWLQGRMTELETGYYAIYYLLFLGCVFRAFQVGAARAGGELFPFVAVVTLLVPLSSLLSGHAVSNGGFAIEAFALLSAWVFFRLGKLCRKRAVSAPEDSVWHVQSCPSNPLLRDRARTLIGGLLRPARGWAGGRARGGIAFLRDWLQNRPGGPPGEADKPS